MIDQNEQPDNEVIISRHFDAPRELVFAAWIEPEQLIRWYAPQGCSIQFRTLDPRSGGRFHSCILAPTGQACWCIGQYREVSPPERLVFTMQVANEHGQAVEPTDVGMDPEWPSETLVSVTFEAREGGTLLTLHQTVSEKLAKRTGAYPSWLQMLDNLSATLQREAQTR